MSVMRVSREGETLGMDVALDGAAAGFSARLTKKLEEVSSDLTEKSRKGALLQPTLRVHRYSCNLDL